MAAIMQTTLSQIQFFCVNVHEMAWCQTGNMPLSEPMMAWFVDAFFASLNLNESNTTSNSLRLDNGLIQSRLQTII